MNIRIEWSNGSRHTTYHDSPDSACTAMRAARPDCHISDEWQPAGYLRERLLVWPDEESSVNDDGSRAIAEIVMCLEVDQ